MSGSSEAKVIEFRPVEEGDVSALGGFKIKNLARGIMQVTLDDKFYVAPDTQDFLEVLDVVSKRKAQNLMVTGPQGCGKTELGIWFAAKFDRPVIIMNCAVIRETKDWFGYRDAKEGSLFWHKADFVRAAELGNCVIILDEFNRLHSTLHNSLYPLLDARRMTFVEEIEEVVKVAKGTMFIATCNLGFSHTGTHTMDSAIEDRFSYRIEINFPPIPIEAEIIKNKTGVDLDMAKKLARLGDNIRKKAEGSGATLSRAVSTRQLLYTAALIRRYAKKRRDLKKVFDYTIVPQYCREGGTDSEQAQVLQIIQGIFG